MTEERAAERPKSDVVLEYEQQQGDLAEAIALIVRKRKSGLVFRPPVIITLGLLGVALLALEAGTGDLDVYPFGIVLYAVLLYFWPRLAGRQMMKAVAHQGPLRVTVDEEGVRTAGAKGDARMLWSNFGSYAEGDRVFVLRSPDRAGSCANVLVKRGAGDPADIDRLRALLDSRLPRV
ncbi:YcxB family protein [Streptomyces sp. NPDC015171]|uniref:YcxB family protein n=1 Tax=Streptomyces sp. NPDC015171 TaxID=3364945 RepID=UPI0036F5A253